MLIQEQLAFSTASLPNRDLLAAIEKGRAMGFASVELLAFDGARHSQGRLAGFWFDELDEAQREQLRDAVADFAGLSTHAPFLNVPLFTHNPGLRREARRQIEVALEATSYLDGAVSAVHVNAQPFLTPRDYWTEMLDTFRELGDLAASLGVRIGIETGYPNTAADYVGLIWDIDHDCVGACIDVGHIVAYLPRALRGTPEGIAAFNDTLMAVVEELREKVFQVHLHDVRANDFRDHRAAGRGIIDFDRLFRYLHRSGFDGPMAFELEEPDVEEALAESKVFVETVMKRTG